mgnify:CR=1 FL=1
MAGLLQILESLRVKCHLYTDNTHFVVTFGSVDEMSARSKIVEIFAAIKAFMFENCLKLNASKTVFIPFSRYQTEFEPLQLDSEVPIPATYASRNLGAIFDSKLSFSPQISNVRKFAFFHLKRIQIVKYIGIL